MVRSSSLFLAVPLLILLLAGPSPALAWGQAGHAIVATIAQSLLHPAVRTHLCTILPSFTSYTSPYPRKGAPHTHCHLATLASWPDTAKWRMPWSGHLHYVNPVHDEPPETCTYGEQGFTDQDNVLTGLVNYTRQLRDGTGAERDVALRFVTHFVGDLHQPLHLTGRARGGNDVWVRYEGRKARLHSVWDGQIINTQIRNLYNYTTPLPSLPFESTLQGQVWDPYIRWIMAEGLGIGKPSSSSSAPAWWENEWSSWASCPDSPSTDLDFKDEPTNRVDETDLPLCPMAWSRPMHPLVCQYAFASPVPAPGEEGDESLMEEMEEGYADSDSDAESGVLAAGGDIESERRRRRRRRRRRPSPAPAPAPTTSRPPPPGHPTPPHPSPQPDLPELADEYLKRISDDLVIQRQLALGGVRLAAIVNSVLLEEALRAEKAAAEEKAAMPATSAPMRESWSERLWDSVTGLVRKKLVLGGLL